MITGIILEHMWEISAKPDGGNFFKFCSISHGLIHLREYFVQYRVAKSYAILAIC